MSGVDELRPTCKKCDETFKGGLANRRIMARNRNGNNVVMLSSIWDESVTGARIVRYYGDSNKKVTYTYCVRCGTTSQNESDLLEVKQYIAKYDESFGMHVDKFNERLNIVHKTNARHIEPNYSDYLGDEDTCSDCGNQEEDCSCMSVCSGCGRHEDDCVCCVYCGDDKSSCGCVCEECGGYSEECGC